MELVHFTTVIGSDKGNQQRGLKAQAINGECALARLNQHSADPRPLPIFKV